MCFFVGNLAECDKSMWCKAVPCVAPMRWPHAFCALTLPFTVDLDQEPLEVIHPAALLGFSNSAVAESIASNLVETDSYRD